jgi:hypothetical protein
MHDADDRDDPVALVLRTRSAPGVPPDFLVRVNAGIDEVSGWLGLANYRAWTLGLVPAAAALALVAVLWTPAGVPSTPSTAAPSLPSSASFSPASRSDWQRDVSPDALLDAALHRTQGRDVR